MKIQVSTKNGNTQESSDDNCVQVQIGFLDILKSFTLWEWISVIVTIVSIVFYCVAMYN